MKDSSRVTPEESEYQGPKRPTERTNWPADMTDERKRTVLLARIEAVEGELAERQAEYDRLKVLSDRAQDRTRRASSQLHSSANRLADSKAELVELLSTEETR